MSGKERQIAELEKKMIESGFWDDNEKAQKVLQEHKSLQKTLETWKELVQQRDDLEVLLELAEEDTSILPEIEERLNTLARELSAIEFQQMFSGEHDKSNAILSINSGAGGTESQDWAQILMRMYLRWCERKGFEAKIVDILPGEEAGIKNATITVNGDYAYGYLKSESGVHRLIRLSPFDANHRRHTSFASVFVFPEIDETINLNIREEDLRIDTYRSSGAGGQHVNVTDSAVRITHLPTGIVVQCQNERSQHRNREMAMKILKARLYEIYEQERKEELEKIQGEKKKIAWGSQIRSYVLHPYQLVKDHRTNLETSNVQGVLDGEIDEFIKAYLLNN
ncbi:MAG TPA: peptide chain release factor 2 [Candidatus Limnocylindrales bacterium]|nr:peptide chain release factor 2 [Candidatus Limnocylindrales bacterium]